MSSHAKLWQPSGAPIWANCNGAPEFVADIPNPSNERAAEGTAAHWVAQYRLTKGVWPEVGNSAPNGVEITEEMIDYVSVYVDLVESTPATVRGIEEKVHSPRIEKGCFGTVDHWCFDQQTSTLYDDDLKYGWGIVESWEQHLCYACGLLDKYPAENVVMRIIQPRPRHPQGPIREWRIKAVDLKPHFDRLHNAANMVFPMLTSGPWCKNCRGALKCSANQNAAMNAVDVSELPVPVENLNIGRELDILQRAAEAIKNRLTKLETEAEGIIQSGGYVDGWIMSSIPSGGKSSWTSKHADIVALAKLLNINVEKQALITPIQAMKKGMPEPLVKAHSQMPKPSLKLTKAQKTNAFVAFNGDVK
jgi:hypothetical protein